MARHLRRNGWCVGRHRVRRLMSRVGSRRSTSGLRPASRIPAQDLSVPAASPDDRSAELRVVRRHHLYPDAPRLPLSGGDHGLGEPQGPGLAVIEHDGRRILCRGTGRSDCPAWPARHLQHRSGLAVHQLRLHNHAEGCWHPRLDGWSWPLDGQRIHRATWRSLKYGCVFLNAFETGSEAQSGIDRWIRYYNTDRPHSALAGRTPDEVYATQANEQKLAA